MDKIVIAKRALTNEDSRTLYKSTIQASPMDGSTRPNALCEWGSESCHRVYNNDLMCLPTAIANRTGTALPICCAMCLLEPKNL